MGGAPGARQAAASGGLQPFQELYPWLLHLAYSNVAPTRFTTKHAPLNDGSILPTGWLPLINDSSFSARAFFFPDHPA
jgi:hypothetical protein